MAPPEKSSNENQFTDPKDYKNERGYNQQVCYEPKIDYAKAESENFIGGPNNAWLVFGRDRPGNFESGYGGDKASTDCGRIELCVGRSRVDDGKVHPNIGTDAAKIYISQKTDIDDAFKIICKKSPPSIGRSAIGIKADDIRIVSRNSMKLVTNTDQRLSTKVNSYKTVGVQIIANNDDRDLQPMVKGDNLRKALLKLEQNIVNIASTLYNFMNVQREYNLRVANHTHHGSIDANKALETSVSPLIKINEKDMIMGLLQYVDANLRLDVNNIKSWSSEYLNDSKPENFINSLYNKVN